MGRELRKLIKLKDKDHNALFAMQGEKLDLGMTELLMTELRGPLGL
jgi:hypothetical protein